MLTFERSITIEKPIETVFEFVSDPRHLVQIWPSLLEVTDVTSLPKGGYRYFYVYKMGEVRFEGKAEMVEYLPTTRIVTKIFGGIEGTITFAFQPIGQQTKVFFTVAYTIPTTLAGKLPEPTFVELSLHEAELVLANLKTLLPVYTPTPIFR